jgi:hypothetical protein
MQLYLGLSVKQMDKLRHLMQHWKRPGFIPSRGMKAKVINDDLYY